MKRITKTFERTTLNVTAFDLTTMSAKNEHFIVKEYDEKTALQTVRKALETDTLKIVKVEVGERFVKRYAMDEAEYIKRAEKIDGVKIGNINRTISEYFYEVLVYDYDKLLKLPDNTVHTMNMTLDKEYKPFSDEALKVMRKEYESGNIRIIEVTDCKKVSGMYTMTEHDFMKYGYEIEMNDKDNEDE